MSKFQVGDPVRVKHDHSKTGCVSAIDVNQVLIGKGSPLEGSWWHVDKLELEPHVPDVDGNPIRVGQLVESMWDEGRHRVVTVDPNPEWSSLPCLLVDGLTGWRKAKDFRVLTADDLFVPPEPDTRDAVLRVTVHDVAARDSDMVGELREMLNRWTTHEITVEVVDDE